MLRFRNTKLFDFSRSGSVRSPVNAAATTAFTDRTGVAESAFSVTGLQECSLPFRTLLGLRLALLR